MVDREALRVASCSISLMSMARLSHSRGITVVAELFFRVLSASLFIIDFLKILFEILFKLTQLVL